MTDLLKTPKEEFIKNDLKKEKKKFWQQEAFFFHLVIHSVVSFTLITVAITFLAYSLPFWENIFFPGLQKIDPLQRDLTILQAKVDHFAQSLQNIQDKSTDMETLKGQLSVLQQKVTVLERDYSKPSSANPQPVSGSDSSQSFIDLKPSWEKLQNLLQSGEACTEEFNQLKSKIPSSIEKALQTLLPFTESPAKSLFSLQTELEKIHQEIKSSPIAEELVVISQPPRWWHIIWDYLSQWIHISALSNQASQVSLLTAVERALESLRTDQLTTAINYLQSIQSVEAIKSWLADAKRRQQCDQDTANLGKEINAVRQCRHEK